MHTNNKFTLVYLPESLNCPPELRAVKANAHGFLYDNLCTNIHMYICT